MNVAPGSGKVNWKREFFVIRTHRTDVGPTGRIIQIAYALFRGDEVKWSGSTLLRKPEGVEFDEPWVKRNLQVCDATVSDLESAPPFEQVLDKVLSGVTCPVWVGLNLPLEYSALSRERVAAEQRTGRSLRKIVPMPRLNVSVRGLASLLYPADTWDLGRLCRRHKINMEGIPSKSNTLQLAEATGRVLLAMMDKLPNDVDAMQRKIEAGNAKAARPRGPVGFDDNAAARRRRRM